MKKVLFIDRDGTLIVEPTTDFQIDSLEKLAFLPKVITALAQISKELDYELVMVTNQDGLGTESFPEDTFIPAHEKMMLTFENEGVIFREVLIDKSFEEENLPTRKPNTGLLTHYLDNVEYDLENSFVIGDRLTDVKLAQNINSKAILVSLHKHQTESWKNNKDLMAINPHLLHISNNWTDIYLFLKDLKENQQNNHQNNTKNTSNKERTAHIHRKTNETDIEISLNLDKKQEKQEISQENGVENPFLDTGIGFFDHLLDQIVRHAGISLHIKAKGDLYIDEHHTVEDTALALGEAFLQALGDKRGITRYGHFLLPMDETLAQVALDFSGRPFLVWEATFNREKVGEFSTELFEHFFKSFSDAAKCNINIKIEGKNAHHQIEATFKAFAKALKMAIKREDGNNEIPSTKGVL